MSSNTISNTVLDEAKTSQFQLAFDAITQNMGRVLRGKRQLIENALLCLVSGGHILVEDVPGVGKTMLAKALSASIGSSLGRIQFTPDLLPADVTGVSIFNREAGTFEFRPGPVFTELVLADEINRAAPKTQSALLEAMAEGQVTVDGETHDLPHPFMVVATQNPVEQEGTYPLPESQLDRFQLKVSVGYPDIQDEVSILETHEREGTVKKLQPVASIIDVVRMVELVPSVQIAPSLRHYIVSLTAATRQHPSVLLGVSPRGSLSLQKTARARALSQGRNFVTDDDIKTTATSVMAHRIILSPEAHLQSISPEAVINQVLSSVPVPRG